MGNELIKARAIYAVDTIRETAVLSFQQFFPLLIGWFVSLGGPVALLAFGAIVGAILDKMVFHTKAGGFTLIGLLIPGLLIGWFYGGWALLTLKVARRLPISVKDLFRPIPVILNCLAVLVITTICMGLTGWLVIVAPLLFLKWQLAPYYVIDRGYGPIQALKQSWHDTNRVFAPLALADLMLYGAMMLSTPTIVGPIICHMLSGVLSALVYSKWLTDENNPEFRQLVVTDDFTDVTDGPHKEIGR
jgi:hypothetical protein